jgi:hypothetical protein
VIFRLSINTHNNQHRAYGKDETMKTVLERKIERLEDIEAIKKLKHRYCFLVDAGIAGDMTQMDVLLANFTEEAWVDFSHIGVHKGKKEIESFFKELVPQTLSYAAHLVSNPVIEVEKVTACGSWYFFVPCTFRKSQTPVWILGKYEEAYVKINGQWYWKSMTARFDFISPFEDGWVKNRMADI